MERRGGHRQVETKTDTPPTEIEVFPIHDIDPEALTSFFRDGYGCAYLGDDSLYKKIQRSSYAVILGGSSETESIAGAALVARRRVLAMATSPDSAYEGARYDNAVALLRECIARLQCQWLTIGREYSRVQDAAYEAGLRRINDQELVQGLLTEAGEFDNYDFRYDETGHLLITRVASEFRPNYEQQFWVHIPDEV